NALVNKEINSDFTYIDNGTTVTVLNSLEYFDQSKLRKHNLQKLGNLFDTEGQDYAEAAGPAVIYLPYSIRLEIAEAVYCPSAAYSILRQQDIRRGGYECNTKPGFLQIIKYTQGGLEIHGECPEASNGLYVAQISPKTIQVHYVNEITLENQMEKSDPNTESNETPKLTEADLWHQRMKYKLEDLKKIFGDMCETCRISKFKQKPYISVAPERGYKINLSITWS
ncbi:hypothetical protein HK096_002095, partial [Nowakowskiella sp. JEL0078]